MMFVCVCVCVTTTLRDSRVMWDVWKKVKKGRNNMVIFLILKLKNEIILCQNSLKAPLSHSDLNVRVL